MQNEAGSISPVQGSESSSAPSARMISFRNDGSEQKDEKMKVPIHRFSKIDDIMLLMS